MYAGFLIYILGVSSIIVTAKKSLKIYSNAIVEGILEIPNHGYKLKKEVFAKRNNSDGEFKENYFDFELKTKPMSFPRISLFIPGLNIYISKKETENIKKEIFNNFLESDAVSPMTIEEKNQYLKLDDEKQKLIYLSLISTKENEDEKVVGFNGIMPKIIDVNANNTIYLKNERLLPLSYSLEEVKKLNSVTNLYYQLGRVNDINTAIIGLPNDNCEFTKIKLKNNNSKYEFKKIAEEEAKKEKFVIYPLTGDIEKLNDCIETIREDRKIKNNLNNEFLYNTQENHLNNYYSNIDNTSFKRNELGPVLKKTLYKK